MPRVRLPHTDFAQGSRDARYARGRQTNVRGFHVHLKKFCFLIPDSSPYQYSPHVLIDMGTLEGEESMDLIEQLRQRKTFLSTVEVMALLDTSRGVLCAWVRAGHMSAIRKGNAYLFDPCRLADWLEERKTATGRRTA